MRIYAEDERTKGGTYTDAALELGHFYLNQRKFTEAVDYFSRIPPEDARYAEAAFYTGLIYWQQNNFEQSLAVLRPLADDLKLITVHNTLGSIAIQASRAEKNKEKSAALLDEGLKLLKEALGNAPEDTNIRFNYSLALFLNNNFTEAAQNLRDVLAAKQKDGEAYFLLAKSLEKLGDQAATEVDNKARQFLVTKPNDYARLESDWKKARLDSVGLRIEQPQRKDFVSVILKRRQNAQVSPQISETEAQLIQAREFYKAGRDAEAMDNLRRFLSREPMNAEAHFLVGSIHLRRGDFDLAVSSLKTAIFWDNELIEAHIMLGKIFLEKGDCLQAKSYATSALKLEEEDPDAVALQRQVERCSK